MKRYFAELEKIETKEEELKNKKEEKNRIKGEELS